MTSSSAHNITSINLSTYTQVSSIEKESPKGWVDYGDRNLYPQYLIELSEQSPVHGSLLRSISQMIAGKKLYSDDIAALIKIKDLGLSQSVIECTAYDLQLQGGFFWEIVWRMDRSEVATVNHLPFECCRLSIDKESGEVNGVWYSNDWSNIRKKRNTPKYIPLFDERYKGTEPRQALVKFKNYTTANYYGKPDYISSLSYIELSRQIALFHVNNIQNGLFPSFIVNMNNGVPETEQEMELVKREIERNISGARNAGKFMVMFNQDKDRAAEFLPFPVNDADKLYQYHEDVCTRQIMISHRVTSPLLFGIRDGAGLGSNKDEMDTALRIFNQQVIEPSQRLITNEIEMILQSCNVSADVYIISNDEKDENVVNTTPAELKKKVSLEIPDSFEPTNEMAAEAELGLKWREEYGRGGTEVGVARARDISNKRNLSFDTVQRMNSYFARHEVDKKATGWNDGEEGFPTAGRIAWQLWGGDAGQSWSARIVDRYREEMSSQELCCSTDVPTFTKEQENWWIKHLEDKGEQIDYNEWELLSEEECGTSEEENELLSKLQGINLAYGNYANGDDSSKWGDVGLYKLRYAYSTNLSANSRDFCKAMVNNSLMGLVYRKEDIDKMSSDSVNEQFAPTGESSYNIFTWKGGVYCHHKWMRRIYFRKREGGKFLPNDGLNNDKRVGNNPYVKPKGDEGIAPIDTPTRGSLKY